MEKIRKIEISHQAYPCSLKGIENAPRFIYLKGEIPALKFFAMVGTRRYSDYGKQITLEIGQALTRAGLGIISGMAQGIDTFAHQACLEAKGKTIAVLATGLDEASIYPKENIGLSREIVEKGGCLISEFPPGTRGYKGNFPLRNRLISALSSGVLVVEAKKKSGALITARWAQKQGRKLFALPGPIYSLYSWGPNYLIKNGAKLVQSADDILKELDFSSKLNFKSAKKQELLSLSLQENLVLEALKQEPLHIESVIKRTGLGPAKTCSILALMEIRGRIKNFGGNVFGLVNQGENETQKPLKKELV